MFQFPLTALREITILQQNQHKNLVKHIEVCKKSKKSGTVLIFWLFFVIDLKSFCNLLHIG